MSKFTVQEKKIIADMRAKHPEMAQLSDAQILTIYNEELSKIQLSKDEKISVFRKDSVKEYDGLTLEREKKNKKESGNIVIVPDMPKNDPNLLTDERLKSRIKKVSEDVEKSEKSNGFLGKLWSGIKNITGLGDSSDKVRKQIREDTRRLLEIQKDGTMLKSTFRDLTGEEYSDEKYEKFLSGEIKLLSEQKLDGYKEGQEMASDTIGDMISGIGALGIYSAAVAAIPFTGGLSIVAGTALATAFGGGIKIGIKALDTVGTDRKYESSWHDFITGGFSGALAPFTGGIGGAAGKALATKFGLQVMKAGAETAIASAGKSGAAQVLKTALINPAGYEYIGGTAVKRGLALGTEMAVDGALGGAIDGGFREGLDNDWDMSAMANGTLQGGIGGGLMAPIIGGGFKFMGKAGHKIGEKKAGKALPDKLEQNPDNIAIVNQNYRDEDLAHTTNQPKVQSEQILQPELITKNQEAFDSFMEKMMHSHEWGRNDVMYDIRLAHEMFKACINPETGIVNKETLDEVLQCSGYLRIWDLNKSAKYAINPDGTIKKGDALKAAGYYYNVWVHCRSCPDVNRALKACRDENGVFQVERLEKFQELLTDKINYNGYQDEMAKKCVNPDGSWNETNFQLFKSWNENPKISDHNKMAVLINYAFDKDGTLNEKALKACMDRIDEITDSDNKVSRIMHFCTKDGNFNEDLYNYHKHLENTYGYSLADNYHNDFTVEQMKIIEPLIALIKKDGSYQSIPFGYAMSHANGYNTNILKKMADMAKVEGIDLNIITKYLQACSEGVKDKEKMWELNLNAIDAFPKIMEKAKASGENPQKAACNILYACRDANGYFQQSNLDMYDRVNVFAEYVDENAWELMNSLKDRRGIISPSKLEALKDITNNINITSGRLCYDINAILKASEDIDGNLSKTNFNIIKKWLKKEPTDYDTTMFDKIYDLRIKHNLSDKDYIKLLLAIDKLDSLKLYSRDYNDIPKTLEYFFDISGNFSQKNVDDFIKAEKIVRKKFNQLSNIYDKLTTAKEWKRNGYRTINVHHELLNSCFNPKTMEFDFEILNVVIHFMEHKIHPGWGVEILEYLRPEGQQIGIDSQKFNRLNKICEYFKDQEKYWSQEHNVWGGGKMSEFCGCMRANPLREEVIDLIINKKIPLNARDAYTVLINTTKENLDFFKLLCLDKDLNFPIEHVAPIMCSIDAQHPKSLEVAKYLCTNKELDFPKDKIAFATSITWYSSMTPEILGSKIKKFLELGFDDNFIREIVEGAKTFSIYTDDVLKSLDNMKQRGINIHEILYSINGGITDDLAKNIERLTTLIQIMPEEKLAFKKAGVDIDTIMEALSKKIDTKYPTINTTKEGRKAFLKSIANTDTADNVIKNANFEQFGKDGIPLEYSREEFIRNMNKITGSASHGDLSEVTIPKLELTSEDAVKTKAKIEELRQTKHYETVEIIMDGKKETATRFHGTQGGSNTGYMTQIGDKLYYVKYPEKTNLGQSVEEVMAADLYRVAGIDAPNLKYVYDENDNIIGMASEYVPDVSMPDNNSSLHDAFAVDAWLANWDAPKMITPK